MKTDLRKDFLRKNNDLQSEETSEEFTKKYYKIQEVADFLDVPQSTLRFWEKEFEEVRPVRSGGNVRYYTPETIRTLRIIHFLVKQRGLKIEAAKEQLRTNKNNVSRRIDAIRGLEEAKEELKILLHALEKRR